MPRLRRAAEPRDVHQRGEPDMVAPAQRQQPLGDEGAVETRQRHHVGDRAERDEIERAEQIGLGPRHAPEAARAQLAVDGHDRHEHEADSGEMAEPGEIVEPVGIDHRERGRQHFVGEMMIDHDHIEAEPLRFGERLVAGGAAIDRDQERGALPGERAHRIDVGAVAFEHPVRDMDQRIEAGVAQEARQRRRRGRAVDVVVAEDRDGLAAHDRIGDARRGGRHVGQRRSGRASARARSDRGRSRTSSTSTPRPARMRASSSGTFSWRCAIASARAAPRSSSRSRQARPHADCSTPRNRRRAGARPAVQPRCSSTPATNHFQKSLRYWMKPDRSASLS